MTTKTKTMKDKQGCSTCPAGQEQYEEYTLGREVSPKFRGQKRVQTKPQSNVPSAANNLEPDKPRTGIDKPVQKKAEGVPFERGKDGIRKALPLLYEHQIDNVEKAERRFEQHRGFGIFDGTGTGKTLSGLGIAKRFIMQGRKNILIVTTSNPKAVAMRGRAERKRIFRAFGIGAEIPQQTYRTLQANRGKL